MGLFEKIFGKRPEPKGDFEGTFKLLNGYTPRFTSWGGGVYESELIRAAINARATHISKLHVETKGAARPALQSKLKHAPNEFQTWSQFLYRLSTILDVHNTAFITPIYDEYGQPSGIYTPLPSRCEIVQYDGVPYLRYEFSHGEKASVELAYCGIMTKYQYKNDFFGENNSALFPTMELIHIQNQGIEEGVKNAASYKFIAKVSNFSKPEDLAKERKRFSAENFAADADAGGLLLFPNTYTDIRQLETKPFVVDAEQMAAIKASVFEYFGVNEDILTNSFKADTWSAFYEGAVEPWALQFSETLTKQFFTLREQSQGNFVMATANRLQYMSNADKLAVVSQMADRGLMTRNELREIFNLAPLPDPVGSQIPARGEYYNVGDENDGNEDDNGQT